MTPRQREVMAYLAEHDRSGANDVAKAVWGDVKRYPAALAVLRSLSQQGLVHRDGWGHYTTGADDSPCTRCDQLRRDLAQSRAFYNLSRP